MIEDEVLSPVFKLPKTAEWREDRTCSYCGSISPELLFELIEQDAKIIPTDKSYKIYIAEDADAETKPREAKKFYFQHFNERQKERFIDLMNTEKINIGYPGHFYVMPFFIQMIDPVYH